MIDLFSPNEMFTIFEVSKRLKISVSALRDKVFRNQIPYYKLGPGKRSALRFNGEELNQWLDDNKGFRNRSNHSLKQPKPKMKKLKTTNLNEFSGYLEDLTIKQSRIQ